MSNVTRKAKRTSVWNTMPKKGGQRSMRKPKDETFTRTMLDTLNIARSGRKVED